LVPAVIVDSVGGGLSGLQRLISSNFSNSGFVFNDACVFIALLMGRIIVAVHNPISLSCLQSINIKNVVVDTLTYLH
jgi:hypothetical protein